MLIQVVPCLPPTVSGVGDYALELARTLRQDHSLDSSFVVCDPDHLGVTLDGFQVRPILRRTPSALSEACEESMGSLKGGVRAILIHYVGYGYHSRGAPLWFMRGVRKLKSGFSEAASSPRLLAMFHELFAMGKPWQSSFWLSPVQRAVAANIARVSDGILTNRAASAEWLAHARERESPCPISWLPVFSNVGEPAQLKPIIERPHAAVIWGSAEARRTIYQNHARALLEFCSRQEVVELHDIGASLSETPSLVGVRTLCHGVLPPDRIGAILAGARFGIFAYNLDYVTKSGVNAAYRAYGLVPVHTTVGKHRTGDGDDLAPMLSLSDAGREKIGDEVLEILSVAARKSYRTHGKSEHAKAVHHLVQDI